jgi:hypothetical protein
VIGIKTGNKNKAGLKVSSLTDIHNVRRRKKFYLIVIIISVLTVIIFGFAYWLVFISDIFKIDRIVVVGAKRIGEEEIKLFLTSEAHNYFWFSKLVGSDNMLSWPYAVDKSKLERFHGIKSVRIVKDQKNRTIEIHIVERGAYGLWCFDKKQPMECFWFDEEGLLFEEGFAVRGSLIPAVNDYARDFLQLGSYVVDSDYIQNLFSIFSVIKNSGLAVREVRYDGENLAEIGVLIYGGPKINFSLRFGAANTLEIIKSLQNRNSFENLEYIDFTVENRAYYK